MGNLLDSCPYLTIRIRPFDGGQSSAILRYAGAPEHDPMTQHGPYVLPYYDESIVHHLITPGAPGVPEPDQADVNINMVPELSNWKIHDKWRPVF
ncbi:hypothetical protein J3R83DRAFT_8722 [Lanmaoa asiatica]|nr:hypothetical protein J3R83DRAFT_8722 [Lanmaoa asiatica]